MRPASDGPTPGRPISSVRVAVLRSRRVSSAGASGDFATPAGLSSLFAGGLFFVCLAGFFFAGFFFASRAGFASKRRLFAAGGSVLSIWVLSARGCTTAGCTTAGCTTAGCATSPHAHSAGSYVEITGSGWLHPPRFNTKINPINAKISIRIFASYLIKPARDLGDRRVVENISEACTTHASLMFSTKESDLLRIFLKIGLRGCYRGDFGGDFVILAGPQAQPGGRMVG